MEAKCSSCRDISLDAAEDLPDQPGTRDNANNCAAMLKTFTFNYEVFVDAVQQGHSA